MKTICKIFELKGGCLNIWDWVYSRCSDEQRVECVSARLRKIRRWCFDVGVSETYLNASSPRAALSLVQAEFSSAASTSSCFLVFVSFASLVTFTSSSCVTRLSRPWVTSPLAAKPGLASVPQRHWDIQPDALFASSLNRRHLWSGTCVPVHVSPDVSNHWKGKDERHAEFPKFAADETILTEKNLLWFLWCSSWQIYVWGSWHSRNFASARQFAKTLMEVELNSYVKFADTRSCSVFLHVCDLQQLQSS